MAARGMDGRTYPCGDESDTSLYNSVKSNRGSTSPVSNYPNDVSTYGCHDMAGNVRDWCARASAFISPGTWTNPLH